MTLNRKKAVSWMKTHKYGLTVGVFLLILIGMFFVPTASPLGMTGVQSESFRGFAADSSLGVYEEGISTQSEFQLRSGSVSVRSDDHEEARSDVRNQVEILDGRITDESKHETDHSVSVSLSVRVPADNFDQLFQWINDNYNVESSSVNLETVEADYIQNEVAVLLESIETMDRLLERAERLEDEAEAVRVVAEITQHKLQLVRQLRQYGFSLEQLEEREAEAQLYVTITEEKDDLFPDNVGDQLKRNLREGIQSIINVGLDLVIGPIVVLVTALKWIIYVLIVALPVWIIYRIWKRVKK